MAELILHPETHRATDAFLANPSHAALLIGPEGCGKKTLGSKIAEDLLQIPSGTLDQFAYACVIRSGTQATIGITDIRDLQMFLTLKVPSRTVVTRSVLIEEAERLTQEAQNALLKTLEEPPMGTVIVMTTSNDHALLPTLLSRVQPIRVMPPPAALLLDYYKGKGHTESAIKHALALSGCLPGLMNALLTNESHPLLAAVEIAKRLLTASSFERLIIIEELTKQKGLAKQTLQIIQQMAHISLQTASGQATERWLKVLEAAYSTQQTLTVNAQPKLVLTRLALSL